MPRKIGDPVITNACHQGSHAGCDGAVSTAEFDYTSRKFIKVKCGCECHVEDGN